MQEQTAEQLLSDTQRSLIEVYLDLQVHFEKKYGKNAIVIMEVGSFFEVYGVDNKETTIGKPKEIAGILNIQLTRKNKSIAENNTKNPLLAGFPTASFERYITRIIEEKKYTIILIRQKGLPPKVTRYVDKILSPGVNFDYAKDANENFVTSIIIDKNKGLYSAGYSAVDVTTGKTYLFEIHSTLDDPTYALDEIFSLLQTHTTAEILITLLSKEIDLQHILNYLEIEHDKTIQTNTKRLNVHYQNELFKQTYIIQSFLSPIEFLDLERKPLASEGLALLVEFIIEHDFKIIEKLGKPTHLETSNLLYLGNNPLEQLGIISKNSNEQHIFNLVNKTSTALGKRLLKNRLLNPITIKEELENRYELTDTLSDHTIEIDNFLKNIYDIERISRRIRIGRLDPFEINFLYDSIINTEAIIEYLEKIEATVLLDDFSNTILEIKSFKTHLEQTFIFDQTSKVTFAHIETNFFTHSYNTELDTLLLKKEQFESYLETIRQTILQMIEEITGKREEHFVQIKQLDKEGHYLCMTKSRYHLIEELFHTQTITIGEQVLPLKSFKRKVQTNNVKITAEIIETISDDIVLLQKQIIAITKELFLQELEHIDKRFHETLTQICEGIANIDVTLSNSKTAKQYNFTRPKIVETPEQDSTLEIHDLRHPLIESREEHGIYIPNTIVMGKQKYWKDKSFKTILPQTQNSDIHGILLYGINSSGKSSLMKSIGIAVVLAQAGLFVPAGSMRFSLFKELFTRIIAKDNIEKGLSSFAVEMMELKNIFNRSGSKSLILGDEISHGTETLSAIAIVSATIERLSDTGGLFLFTTHLHQLHSVKNLQKLQNIVSVHLSVKYDKETDKLIFNRKLDGGSGSSIYGLEFAQSLHMDKKFLDLAIQTRKSLANDYTDLELLTKKQTSKYNKKVFLTSCAICKEKVEDTHHITQQKQANDTGHISHFHKDHKHNLLPICKRCHDKIHTGTLHVRGFIMTSHGLELSYEEGL
jgi:DNA mismatch repair protein MutS